MTICDPESGVPLYAVPRGKRREFRDDFHGASGPLDNLIAYWVPRVRWVADADALRRHLKGYGAWDDLGTVDIETLQARTIFTTYPE